MGSPVVVDKLTVTAGSTPTPSGFRRPKAPSSSVATLKGSPYVSPC